MARQGGEEGGGPVPVNHEHWDEPLPVARRAAWALRPLGRDLPAVSGWE